MIDRLDHFKNIRDPSSLGKVLLVFEMGLGNFFLRLAATIWIEMKYDDGVTFINDRLFFYQSVSQSSVSPSQ